MDIRQRWHGAPVYVWVFGGTVLVGSAVILYRRKKAKAAAQASPASPAMDTSAPLPGWDSLSGALGGSSPTGPIIGYSGTGEPIYGTSQPAAAPAQAAPSSAPAAPVVQSGTGANTLPPDKYSLGQQVTATEKIVGAIFSPVYGWLNETNLGGIYQGGGGSKGIGSLQYGGSYLGYLGSLSPAQQQAELQHHGKFGPGGLSLLPGGGYIEYDTTGGYYKFGS